MTTLEIKEIMIVSIITSPFLFYFGYIGLIKKTTYTPGRRSYKVQGKFAVIFGLLYTILGITLMGILFSGIKYLFFN